jgi:hypothetical protein
VAAAVRKWRFSDLSAADEVVVQTQIKNLCLILNNHLVCSF